MRAQFGALTACALLLVACASNGTQQPIVHPKARKVSAPSAWIPPAATQTPTPQSVATAPPPAVPLPPVQVAASPPPVIVPALPQAAPPAPQELPSEIPARAPRRDKPTWTLPAPKAAPSPIPAPPQPRPAPVAVPVPVPPVEANLPKQLAARPATPPAPAPSLPIAVPTPMPPPQVAPSASKAPLIIARATGTKEARLPCNRANSPHCDLRIYQVNVGTFVDGSSDHNPISGYGPGPHTGDIEGVIGALDHIKAMGFNTIWLTPIFDTKAGQPQSRPVGRPQVNERLDGTGYFPRDYFKIDPQFGTLEQVQVLVDQAHLLGIKVLFDGVFGHHKGNLVASPTGALPVDATAASAYGGTPQTYPGRIVDYSDARSTAFYKEVARFWIDTVGIDGWRLDQVYQVPSDPLREITTEITKAANAQLLSGYVVGEMWGTAAQIRDVLGPSSNPALSSAFDFPTRYALTQTLASDENGGTGKPASTINEAWAMGAHATYPDHAIMNLMLGNHDLVRFGDLIQRAGKGGTDSAIYWSLHKMAFTFMAAWSGPITLYYGEEVGAEVPDFAAKVTGNCAALNQCDDHVGRNMVALPGVNARAEAATAQAADLKAYLTALMTLRTATPALSSGSRTHVFSDRDLYIDLKSDGTDHYLLVMNVGSGPRQATLKPSAVAMTSLRSAALAAGSTVATMTGSDLKLVVPAYGAAILKLEGR